MGNSPSTAAIPALCLAVGALHLANHLNPTPQQADAGAGAAAADQAPPPLGDAARAFLPVAAAGCLCASVALLPRHLRRAARAAAEAAAAGGAGDHRLPGHVAFTALCVSAGLLQYLLFVAPGAGGVVDRAAARAVGVAALHAVPAVSTASFFLSILQIIVGHIRAGGEGGGGGAVAGDGPIGAPVVGILAKAATAVLLFLTAIAVCFTI